jgi:hypothetical protein
MYNSNSPNHIGTPTTPGNVQHMLNNNAAANPLQAYLAQQQQQQEAAMYASSLQQQLAVAQAAAVYGQPSGSQLDPSGQAATAAVDGLGHNHNGINGLGLAGMGGMQNQNLRVGGQHNRALSMPVLGHPNQIGPGVGVNGYHGMGRWAEEDGIMH